MAEKIILNDVVMSASAVKRMFLEGWKFDFYFSQERYSYARNLWVNPDTLAIYETSAPNSQMVVIVLEMDMSFRAKEMRFGWTHYGGEAIPEGSPLGKKLAAYLLMTIDRLGYLSFAKDVGRRTLADYPLAEEYVIKRCEDFYYVAPPTDIPIYVMPKELWSTYQFDKGCDAISAWTENFIAVPDIKWRSPKFEQSIIVHEATHMIQRRKGWLASPAELGLGLYEMGMLIQGMIMGEPLELVAAKVGKSVNLIKRAKGILDQKVEYAFRYYEMPCEVHAFGEGYRFLQSLGLEPDKILAATFEHIKMKGGRLSSRDKDNISGMVYEADRRIEESMAQQEVMARDDTVPEKTPSCSETEDDNPETG